MAATGGGKSCAPNAWTGKTNLLCSADWHDGATMQLALGYLLLLPEPTLKCQSSPLTSRAGTWRLSPALS